MSEEERLHREREKAQQERLQTQANVKTKTATTEKPCPGLPKDPAPCGNNRDDAATGNGTYCTACRKRYQRDRYQSKKLKETGTTVRSYSTTRALGTPCVGCGIVKPNQMGNVNDDETLTMCSECFKVLDYLAQNVSATTVTSIARLILARGEAFGIEGAEAHRKEVERRLYDKWFQEEQDFLIMKRTLLNPESDEFKKEVDPKDFKYTEKEYNAMAATVSNSASLNLPSQPWEDIYIDRRKPQLPPSN